MDSNRDTSYIVSAVFDRFLGLSIVLLIGCVLGGSARSGAQPTDTLSVRIVRGVELGTSYVDTSPAMGIDGTVYVGGWNGGLFAINAEGRKRWVFWAKADIKSTPAVSIDGHVFFGCRDKHLYCVTPQGRLKWKFATGGWVDSSPALGRDGTVYFGSWDGKFYAVDSAGRKLWEFATGGPIDSSPALAPDGTIYFGSHDAHLYALTTNGQLKWKFDTQGQIVASPAIAGDGTVYIPSANGRFYALNPNGSLKWVVWTGGFTESSPVVDGQGEIYVCASNKLLRISAEGTIVWERRLGSLLCDSSPVVLAGNAVLVFAADGVLSARSARDGTPLWQLWMYGPGTASSPVVSATGEIYVGNIHTNFLVVASTNRLGNSAWPMFKRNPRRTGNALDLE